MLPDNACVVVAGGISSRFNEIVSNENVFNKTGGSGRALVKKEFMPLRVSADERTVLYFAVKPFLAVENMKAVVVVYAGDYKDETKRALSYLIKNSDIPFYFVKGGDTRQKSVLSGLKFLYEEMKMQVGLVSIHDGCRPYVTSQLIERVLACAAQSGGAVPGVRVSDTLVKVSEGKIMSFQDREDVYAVQTPQCFFFPDIYFAHLNALTLDSGKNGSFRFTDDSSVYKKYGRDVSVTEGDRKNIKITYKSDLTDLGRTISDV